MRLGYVIQGTVTGYRIQSTGTGTVREYRVENKQDCDKIRNIKMFDLSRIKQLSDEELAMEAQAGSHACFEELVSRYSRRLLHYLGARIATRQDAEDLVQETFLKTYRNIGNFNPQYKFSTWIYTTAGRLAISHYRKKREESRQSQPFLEQEPDGAGDPHEKMIEEEKMRNIWQAAQNLKPLQYQALWLRYVEDMPLEDIARVMDKSGIYVRVLLHRARSLLVEQFQKAGGTVSSIRSAAGDLSVQPGDPGVAPLVNPIQPVVSVEKKL